MCLLFRLEVIYLCLFLPLCPDRPSFDQVRGGYVESTRVIFESRKGDVYRRQPPIDGDRKKISRWAVRRSSREELVVTISLISIYDIISIIHYNSAPKHHYQVMKTSPSQNPHHSTLTLTLS
jgi:hypothetical protein